MEKGPIIKKDADRMASKVMAATLDYIADEYGCYYHATDERLREGCLRGAEEIASHTAPIDTHIHGRVEV